MTKTMTTHQRQRPYKILFITDSDIDGLASTTHIEITRALRELGHEVEPVFLCHNRAGDFQDVSPMHLLSYKSGSYLSSLWMYLELIFLIVRNCNRYDYVIVEPNSALSLFPFALFRSIFPVVPKMVLDVRTQPVEVPDNWRGSIAKMKFVITINMAARFFSGLLAITDEMAKYLKKITKIRMPIGIWTSGVNIDLFDPHKEYEDIPYVKERFVLMYHGVFSQTRGLDRIILAVDEIRKEYPDVLMFFLGDGFMREKMKQMIVEMGLSNNVIVHDPVPIRQIPRYLIKAHVGILAFPDHEWWSVQSPLKLFEYFAMAKPVIATDIPMNRNVIGDTNSAFLIKNNSPEEICAGIKMAITNKEHLSEMGAAGRSLVEKEYTWRKQAHKIVTYLKTLQ